MERFVWVLWRMSLEAIIVIFAVLLLRRLFGRLPKSYSCVLWLFVLIRLLCPAAVSSSLSLMPGSGIWWESDAGPAAEYGGPVWGAMAEGQWNQNADGQSGDAAGNAGVQENAGIPSEGVFRDNPGGTGGAHAAVGAISARMEGLMRRAAGNAAAFWAAYGIWLSLVWLAGAVWLTAAYLVQYLNWKEKVRGCRRVRLDDEDDGGTYAAGQGKLHARIRRLKIYLVESERILEPFVCGIFNPVIYLPEGMEERERAYILRHELTHIRHRDSFVRLLWQIALVLHWFNPFVWLAVSLVQKDMEMFCDESVMRQCGNGARKEYAMTLLRFSVKKSGLPFPVAFGESNTESRIHHILKVKKPALAASVLAVVMIGLAAVFLLTDPESPEDRNDAVAEKESEAEARDEKILAFAQRWTKAEGSRDGNSMAEMLADPSKMDEYKQEDGSYYYGWSSPWPWTDDYRISYAYDRDEVIIYYYANTSDPRIWPWREVLTLTQEDGEYLVDGWELDAYAVRSKAEFTERFHYEDPTEYGGDSGHGYRFLNTPLDMFYPGSETEEGTDMSDDGPAMEETWAYWLIYHENDPYMIDAWETPEKGAATHLYLEGGHAVEAESPWEDKVCLRWEFEDGLTDVICMCHPGAYMEDGTYRESGLWVVERILEEADYAKELKGVN